MNNYDGTNNGNDWNRIHGHRPAHNSSPTYITWMAMRRRCKNKDSYYFKSGVSVCEEWESFEVFLSDMGERPRGCTIDRIDSYGNYNKDNCRWATNKEQALNRRTTKPVLFFGEYMLLTDIAKAFGIPQTTIYRRNKQGYKDGDLVSKNNKLNLRVGSKCASSKLSESDVVSIRSRFLKGDSQKLLAEEYRISGPTISDIVNKKTWRHL